MNRLTTPQVAEIVGCSRPWINQLALRGIAGTKFAGLWFFTKSDIAKIQRHIKTNPPGNPCKRRKQAPASAAARR